jgi:hypothetical protein
VHPHKRTCFAVTGLVAAGIFEHLDLSSDAEFPTQGRRLGRRLERRGDRACGIGRDRGPRRPGNLDNRILIPEGNLMEEPEALCAVVLAAPHRAVTTAGNIRRATMRTRQKRKRCCTVTPTVSWPFGRLPLRPARRCPLASRATHHSDDPWIVRYRVALHPHCPALTALAGSAVTIPRVVDGRWDDGGRMNAAKKGGAERRPRVWGRKSERGRITDPPTLHERTVRAGAPPRIDLDQRRTRSHRSPSARSAAADPTRSPPIRPPDHLRHHAGIGQTMQVSVGDRPPPPH